MTPENDTTLHAPDCDMDEDCSCGIVTEDAMEYRWSAQRVSVGRVVHYHSQDENYEVEGPYAATVVSCDVETGLCELEVLFPTEPQTGMALRYVPGGFPPPVDDGRMRCHGIPFSDSPKAGCWSWPPRV